MFNLNLNYDSFKRMVGMETTVPATDETAPSGVSVVPEEESGSTYKVPYTSILDIQPHSNAERLEVATVYGFQVIVSKGRYKVGDKAVYIPIDSILPANLESVLFPEGSKIKLNNSRVRQIKIRGLASQGMLINPDEITSLVNPDYIQLEQDLKKILNIKKYEPPVRNIGPAGIPGGRVKKNENPMFHKYNGLDNIKWFPNKFNEQTLVVIQEKLHGTNARASIMPFAANSTKKKILQLLRLAPKTENCYGSNNVQKSSAKSMNSGFYGEDIYGAVFNKINVFEKLKFGESVFGEIIGPGIQKGYSYGLNEHQFVLFDVKVLQPDGTQKWLSPSEAKQFAIERGFQFVPILYEGPFNKELAYTMTKGPSVFDPKEKVREGIVIKAGENYSVDGNKQALKWVSEDYLSDTSNTDEH